MAKYLEQPLEPTAGVYRGLSLDLPVLAFVRANWEILVYAGLFIFAAITRFWDLGSRGVHHDESLHAIYSYYLYNGRGYQHDPMMHGPFQFHFTALIYFLFGVGDYTARMLPAIFGTAVVVTPFFLRGFLGRTGALIAAGLLTISPSIFYYGRFARNDIYIVFFNMLLAIAIWRYFAERQPKYLYLFAAALSLGFATKEVTYITVAVFGIALVLLSLKRLPTFPLRLLRRDRIEDGEVIMLLFGTLALPMFAAFIKVFEKAINVSQPVYSVPGYTATVGTLVAAVAVAICVGVSALIGARWNAPVWLRCAVIFWSIFIVLYSTVFTWLPGLATGIWGGLSYWIDQHGVQRGGQPFYYYLVLLPVYEFLPLVFGIAGGIFFAVRQRTPFRLFLIYWLVFALAIYSYAGEKMPWLVIHMAQPLILLAAAFIGQLIDRMKWSDVRAASGWVLIPLVPLTAMAFLGFINAFGSARTTPNPTSIFQAIGMLAVLGLLAGFGGQVANRLRRQQTAHLLLFGLAVLLAGFTLRAAWQVNYYRGDIPVEMLVYTQTSPDVPKIKQQIDLIAQRTGQNENLKITVDATESHTWPWAWYLREYKNVDFPVLGNMSGPPLGTVLILHSSNEQKAKPYLTKFGAGQKYHLRWWFPEDYRDLTPQKVITDLSNFGPTFDKVWRYFMYRQTTNQLGSSDGIVYFPKEFPLGIAAPQKPAVPDEYAAKQTSIRSAQVIGQKGAAPGQFNEPKAAAVDGKGNIYVADTLNHRVQKLDQAGRPLAQVGQKGSADGEFNEPWGVAVDSDGFVYVADTWNHRIQKFDADLKFVTKWGQDLTDNKGQARGNEGRFYGPRVIAIGPDGTLFVTDTGNHRVQRFDPQGKFIAAFGGIGSALGQFREPVGIAVDGQGNVYVADTWNLRIQKFNRDLQPIDEFTLQQGWETQSIINKPYIAVGPTGEIVVTDPENHRLLRLSTSGKVLAVINKFGSDTSSFNLPIGIAIDGRGNVFVAEAGNSRVQRFDPLR